MTQRSRNTNRFCKFHDDYGHDTEDCFELKREIKRLIETGALRKFTTPIKGSQPRTVKEVPPVTDPKTKDVLGNIHVITGGESCSAGTKKRSRAEIMNINTTKHARKTEQSESPVITFCPEDGAHVQALHCDALVVEAVIDNYVVRRILIDEGSSINLITWEACK